VKKLSRVLVLAILGCSISTGQLLVPKKSGIYFRVDDNHPVAQWKAYEAVFNKYGLKTSLAINVSDISVDAASIAYLKEAQGRGHEIMDHTPDHAPQYFSRVADTAYYSGRSGVDHINRDKICLRYTPVDTTATLGSGYLNISGNIVTTAQPGGFANFGEVRQIYFPSLNIICDIDPTSLKNSDASNTDTLRILSAWDEPISLGTRSGVRYMRIDNIGGRLTDDALRLLASRSLSLFGQCNLARPVSWIQPGGYLPDLDRKDVKRILGQEFQYRSAAVYRERSLKVFNEYDPDADRRFAMMWGDFDEENQSAGFIKSLIADQVARHIVPCGLSHFSSTLGGWDAYLASIDSLLSWCVQSGIPVRTEAEWAEILYGSTPDPFQNVIPPLNVDLDGNGVPDGYSKSVDGVLDRTDGIPDSKSCAYALSRNGRLCSTGKLAGVEKGDNDFSLWLKGTPGSKVIVTFRFYGAPGSSYPNVALSYTVADTGWKKYSLKNSSTAPPSLVIPFDVSQVDLGVTASPAPGGQVKISDMEMQKAVPPPPTPGTTVLLQPPDGSTGLPSPIVLQWQAAANSDSYRLQVAADSLFRTEALDDSSVTGTSIKVDSLAGGTKYFWRVRGRNAGVPGSWSAPWAFTTVRRHRPPRVRSAIRDTTVPDTAGFVFLLRLSSVFADDDSLPLTYVAASQNPAVGVMLSGDSLSIRPGIRSGPAQIRITARDSFGGSACDSMLVLVVHLNRPPRVRSAIPDRSVPRNHGWVLLARDLTANFFDPDSDALSFTAVAVDSQVTVLVVNDSLLAASACNFAGRVDIIVTASDPDHASVRDTLLFQIQTVNSPPGPFSQLWPHDGDTLQAGLAPVTFRWHRSLDPDGDTVSYFVNITGGGKDTTLAGIQDTVCRVEESWFGGENKLYTWSVTAKDPSGSAASSRGFVFRILKTTSVVAGNALLPTSVDLAQNFPNPFNPSTTIRYALPRRSHVILGVFNTLGQEVAQLVNGDMEAGYHEIVFTGSGLSSGTYFCRLQVPAVDKGQGYALTRKLLIIR